jgi:hypothetical protein
MDTTRRIGRPNGGEILYDTLTDTLTIGGVMFSPQVIESLIEQLSEGEIGPLYMHREEDAVVFRMVRP